jgi:hypothetical protein
MSASKNRLYRILALVVCLSLLSPVAQAKPFYKTKKFWTAVAVTATAVAVVVATKGHAKVGARHFNPGPPANPAPPVQP